MPEQTHRAEVGPRGDTFAFFWGDSAGEAESRFMIGEEAAPVLAAIVNEYDRLKAQVERYRRAMMEMVRVAGEDWSELVD